MTRILEKAIIAFMVVAYVRAAMTQSDRDNAISGQNAERSTFGLPNFTYNSTIEASAQEHADKCVFQHSANSGYGENIFAGAGSFGTMTYAVQSWASEKHFFNCETGVCSDVCGHYTQIVWKDSLEIGCGLTQCGGNVGVFIVCQYSPPGNWIGQSPFPIDLCSMATAPKSAPQTSNTPTSTNSPSKTPVKTSSTVAMTVSAVSLAALLLL